MRRGALLVLAAGGIAACRSSWNEVRRDETFEPTEAAPVRVAVLRFEDRTGGTSPFLYPFLPFIWLAGLVTLQVPEGTPDSGKGAETLRALLIARLRGSSLNLVDPATVDTTLAHRGLLERASGMDPRELGKLLGVDAILYPELLGWSGRYYVIESRTVVEASIVLRSSVDGSELFSGTVGVSDAAGVSGGPTGYIGAAATPLAALGKGPYRELAIQWAERMGSELAGEFRGESAAGTSPPPAIAVAAITQSPRGGFQPGDLIEVLAVGTQRCRASFDIGTLRVRIPMAEFARLPRTGLPDSGEISGLYRGSYMVVEGDRVAGAPVLVTMESGGGRATIPAENGPVTIAPGAKPAGAGKS
jgi:putative lipoprotein DUF799